MNQLHFRERQAKHLRLHLLFPAGALFFASFREGWEGQRSAIPDTVIVAFLPLLLSFCLLAL